MRGEGSKEAVWGSTVAQAISKRTGARFCSASNMCSRARLSLPPDSPNSSLSPSWIMPQSRTASPTPFIIFFGGRKGLG
eukprot:CAMPEP_0173294728 /NCGR_PEP_ID=MMETSP1143-20121109/14042_1 /TAXON_ID=483371 /ORGANISM="non described non described, Strain CCMP2298" /LENGTH=78 /DNA_ID=CAMNT_0014234453 /DNA_START=464 /DNA_END=697 /DNA_ORIENTATION=-